MGSPRISSTSYSYEIPRDDSGFVDLKGIIELDKNFEYKMQNSIEMISNSKMTNSETDVVSDIQLEIKHEDTSEDFLESTPALNEVRERTTQYTKDVDSIGNYTVADSVNIVIGPALNALSESNIDSHLNNKTDPKAENEKTLTVINGLELDIDGDFVATEKVIPAVKTFVDIMLSDESLDNKSEETEDSNGSSQHQSINPTISVSCNLLNMNVACQRPIIEILPKSFSKIMNVSSKFMRKTQTISIR
ncbi:hypothetical protein M3Y96_00695100 [Aphelenchoides besseyi]|nr:hypothetical protein M3Y96_00695100 [Aphelenchoides besseyi]